jgi:ABC-2 type transport system permease protein
MTDTITLLKVWIREFFGINKILHQKKKAKTIRTIIGVIILIVFFFGLSTIYNIGLAMLLKSIDKVSLLPVIMMTVTSLITLFATLYKAHSILFLFQDYDMVMSLPIKTSTVLASRIWLLYLMNCGFTLLVMIPSGIVYAIFAAPPVWFYLLFLLTLPFIPFIPIILATFIGGIIALITARFQYSNRVATVLYLLFFLAIMWFSLTLNPSNTTDMANLSELLTTNLFRSYPFAFLYFKSITEYSIINTVLFLLLSYGAFFCFIQLFSKAFQPIHTMLTTSKANAHYQLTDSKQSSPFKALYKKELRRYFASTVYVINTAFGVLLALLACVSLLFFGIDQITELSELPNLPLYLAQYTPFVVSLFIALTCTTGSSISIEGKNIWIIKSCPIPIATIFWSKIAVNLTITIPAAILCPTLISFKIPLNPFQIAMTYLIPLLYCFLIAIVGLIMNLRFPMLNWTSETAVVKQSTASLFSLLSGFLLIVIPIGIAVLLNPLGQTLSLGITAIFLLLLTLLCYRYLITNGAKQFLQL